MWTNDSTTALKKHLTIIAEEEGVSVALELLDAGHMKATLEPHEYQAIKAHLLALPVESSP